jgi:hypothetical protein
MSRLRAFAEADLLGLNKIAYVRSLADHAFRPQVRVRTQRRSVIDPGLRNDASLANLYLVAYRGVLQNRVGPNAAIVSDFGFTQQLDKGLNHRIRSHRHPCIDHRCLGPKYGHALCHEPAGRHEPELAIDGHHFGDRISP